MLAQKQPAALQSDLMSGKGRKRRPKSERSAVLASPEAVSAVAVAGPKAATPGPGSLLCAKGNATAEGFRPSYWSYEPVEPPPAQAAPTAPAPLTSIAPPPVTTAYTMPPPPAGEPPPAFDYPCNAGAGARVENETPAAVDRGADRALWLATSKTIAALIGTELDGREAALAARIELQRRSDATSSGARRNHRAAAARITADGLIAELEPARRGSVRALRSGVRSFDAVFVALSLLMMLSAGLLGYSLARSDGMRHGWLAIAQIVPSAALPSGPDGAAQASASRILARN